MDSTSDSVESTRFWMALHGLEALEGGLLRLATVPKGFRCDYLGGGRLVLGLGDVLLETVDLTREAEGDVADGLLGAVVLGCCLLYLAVEDDGGGYGD